MNELPSNSHRQDSIDSCNCCLCSQYHSGLSVDDSPPGTLNYSYSARVGPNAQAVANVGDFVLSPREFTTRTGGLFLFVPDLVRLELLRCHKAHFNFILTLAYRPYFLIGNFFTSLLQSLTEMVQLSPNSAETAIFHSLRRRACFRDETAVDSRALDLRRPVYCVLGIIVDAVDMGTAIAQIEQAARLGSPFLIATPNLNFLVQSRTDQDFKETILDSDLCLADGMLVVWLARLMGLPIKHKVSGSDLFEILKVGALRLKIFFFGGPEGIAEAAADALNSKPNQMTCVGSLYPGFGSVEELSDEGIINSINTSGADFLAVSLGAKKGQLWLQKNHKRLTIPVRAHLGAVLAFQAGSVRRAPRNLQKIGFEWLWRIKEEPYLCGRYINDGCTLLYLLLTRVVPLAAINRWSKIRSALFPCDLIIRAEPIGDSVLMRLTGAATERHAKRAALHFESTLALSSKKAVVIDLSSTQLIDSRFLALLVLFRRNLKNQGSRLIFVNAPRAIKRAFVLNELGFLLVL